jgi:hypothetical protein
MCDSNDKWKRASPALQRYEWEGSQKALVIAYNSF